MSVVRKTHLTHLSEVFQIPRKDVLDVGAARGDFLLTCAREGIQACGIEYHQKNVDVARERATREGLSISIEQGDAEQLPYANNSFSFINASEIIEHVAHPELFLAELYRVLKPGGFVYISVPSRFSWYDTHFHVPFVNWLPRAWSEPFLTFVGKQKLYDSHAENDFQRLSEMHYYTYRGATALFRKHGFVVEDLRLKKIEKRIPRPFLRRIAQIFYSFFIRPWYIRAFHFILKK